MEQIKTFEQYKGLLKEVRQQCRRPFSNNYSSPEDIQRYIDLKRIYYHQTDGGIVLLFDEERYYKACLYLDGEKGFSIPLTDKMVVFRTVYKENKKEAELPEIEENLVKNGFCKQGKSVQVCGKVQKISESSRSVERFVRKLEKAGYRCVIGEESLMERIEALLLDSEIIKVYQIDYRTPQEKLESKEGYLAILDKDGQLCVGSVIPVVNGIAQGIGVAVDERFKMNGLVSVMSFYRMQQLMRFGVEVIQAWVLTDNQRSIEFHKSLGYEFSDKYADEWVRGE